MSRLHNPELLYGDKRRRRKKVFYVLYGMVEEHKTLLFEMSKLFLEFLFEKECEGRY